MTWRKKLKTWRSLNDILHSLSEDDVLALLNEERAGPRRSSMLKRLHQRYSMLRNDRERIEIMKEAQHP
jgi:hypothetical protein